MQGYVAYPMQRSVKGSPKKVVADVGADVVEKAENRFSFSAVSLSWGSPIPPKHRNQDNKQQRTLLVALHQGHQNQCCYYDEIKVFFHGKVFSMKPKMHQLLGWEDGWFLTRRMLIPPEPANSSVMVWFSKS